jgi:hypothetical protein
MNSGGLHEEARNGTQSTLSLMLLSGRRNEDCPIPSYAWFGRRA